MNKQEILKEIKETKEHLASMEKMLKACEHERWKPKTGEDYYCIDDVNKCRRVNFNLMNAYDRDRIRVYNCFRTKEEAEQEAEKILIRRQLGDIARRLNKGKELDWDDINQSKYSILFTYWQDTIGLGTALKEKIQGVIYCLDENFLNVAKNEIGEERLEKYLRGE
jgi:hypothetical protein